MKHRVAAFGLTVFTAFGFAAGCASHSNVALDRAVLAYDQGVVTLVSKLLLLNIARAHRDAPMHFTTVTNIAATYNVQFNASLGPAMTGDIGYLPMPSIGVATAENPTLSLVPMQGEEFMQRLLTPFDERKLTMLLRQGYDVDALLRLTGAQFMLNQGAERRVFTNNPVDRAGYTTFRQVVAHLSSIQDRHALRAEPISFTYQRRIAESEASAEELDKFRSDPLNVSYAENEKAFYANTRVSGRVIITNYEYHALPLAELNALYQEAHYLADNDVLIDIRPGPPGGELPLHGVLRLRSFLNVLTFVGRSIAQEPEFKVLPDPRTPALRENPPQTLKVVVNEHEAEDDGLAVELDGSTFSIAADEGYQWNKKAFSLLCQLFQMSVAPTIPPPPMITISK